MKKNERYQALEAICKVYLQKIPFSQLSQWKEATPLTKELCFGTCRHYFRLAAIADILLKKRPKSDEIWLIILLGLYQLHYLQKPDYAVVKETVALLEKVKQTWAKGLVNAVLRNFCREKERILLQVEHNPSFIYGHETWFINRLKKEWPNHWQSILEGNDCHPPMSLRVNQRNLSRQQYLLRLQEMGIEASPLEFSSMGIRLHTPRDVQELPGFSKGDFAVQDESAQLAADLLDLKPGLRVLDACCAPGGKTCHILEKEPELRECVAVDVDEKRLKRVAENLTRLNLQAKLITGDAQTPQIWWDGRQFDRILLDAPCSALGVIRRHPDIKLLRTEEEIARSVELQGSLLEALWPLLAKQGLLVYATCSVIPQENEEQIAHFLKEHSDCQLAIIEQPWGLFTGHGVQIFPQESKGDGFFYSVLKKI